MTVAVLYRTSDTTALAKGIAVVFNGMTDANTSAERSLCAPYQIEESFSIKRTGIKYSECWTEVAKAIGDHA